MVDVKLLRNKTNKEIKILDSVYTLVFPKNRNKT